MIASLIIIFITFVLTILNKFVISKATDKQYSTHNFFYKVIKSRYTLIILIFALFMFQVIEKIKSNKESHVRYSEASNAYNTLYMTHENVKKVYSSVDSLLSNIDSTLNITKDELKLISNVNDDLKHVRYGINKSINEFNSIKEYYEKQIQIEKEKIREAKPQLEIRLCYYIIDSSTFKYQFEFQNTGIRMADNIIYHALMIFVDSNDLLGEKYICLYKTNNDEANVLSISSVNSSNCTRIFNSKEIALNELEDFDRAYLLLTYEYEDHMNNTLINNLILFCSGNLSTGKKQFGINIKKVENELIKMYLSKNYNEFYSIFYK